MKEWGLKEPGWTGVPCTMRERKDWRERRLRASDQGSIRPCSFLDANLISKGKCHLIV